MNDIVETEGAVDPAEAAFTRMQGELALLRRAIEAMAADRAGLEIPDYSATLGQIVGGLRLTVKEVRAVAEAPALQLTPQVLAGQIEAAGKAARTSDHEALVKAAATMTAAAREIGGWIESARLASLQNWRLIQTGVAGLIGGAILWAAVPGVVATVTPQSWGWPERLAAVSLDGDLWEAGERMMEVADKGRWHAIIVADRLVHANRLMIDGCVATAGKGGKPVRCAIVVDPDPASSQ